MGNAGYTKIPNSIFDDYMHVMSSSVFKVVMCIARKTIGWNKNSDAISLTQLESMTGLSRKTLIAAIKDAVANGWLTQEPFMNTFIYKLGGVFFGGDIGGENSSNGGKCGIESVERFHTQKTLTKENKQKNNSVVSEKSTPQPPALSKQKPAIRAQDATLSVIKKLESAISDSLGHDGISLWQKMYTRFTVAKWIAQGKTSIDALLYSIAYAIEKDGNPGIVFNMLRSAPSYLPAWSEAVDMDTGRPQWKNFIWKAFGADAGTRVEEDIPEIY